MPNACANSSARNSVATKLDSTALNARPAAIAGSQSLRAHGWLAICLVSTALLAKLAVPTRRGASAEGYLRYAEPRTRRLDVASGITWIDRFVLAFQALS